MKPSLLLLPFVFLTALPLAAQQGVVVKRDNGNAGGYYVEQIDWEESSLQKPAGPCRVLEAYIYLGGSTSPSTDTIWVVGDPAEGAISPTSWVWPYNTLTEPIVIEYNGKPGWDTIDLRDRNLRSDGFDRIILQHRNKPGGPRFAIDNNSLATPYSSFMMNPTVNSSLGFPGEYSLPQGDFMVRILVEYDFPSGTTSQAAPAATLVDVAKEVGLTDATGALYKGARVSVADWNGDGWDDIALGGAFFQNRGDGSFQNVTATMGIQAGASVWGDYNNDGNLDCYAINGGAGDRIYRNNGDGSFTDVTAESLVSNPYPTVTPIWFDYNHDGRLDLFISNGRTESGGQEVYFPDQLWMNNGDGSFSNVTEQTGISAGEPTPFDCWGAAPCDYNRDGWTDIFVATYRLAPDLLHRNNAGQSFTEVGVATGVRGEPTASPDYFGHGIGADWGDYNNDGNPDLVVGNLGHPDWRGRVSNPSLIYRNNGSPAYDFDEVHHDLGLKFFEMNAGVVWLDLDLDGHLDLWHCQYAYNAQGVQGEPRRLSRVYINEGPAEGFHLRDRTWHLGSLIHGAWTAARGDFDNDGDLDLVVASPTDAVRLFRNNVERRGRWLKIRLRGDDPHTIPFDGYGTSVTVYAGGKLIYRDLQGGGTGTTGSQNSNELHFGLGNAEIDSVVISYPDGTTQVRTDLQPDRAYAIAYGDLSSVEEESSTGGWHIADASFDAGAFSFRLTSTETLPEIDIEIVNQLGQMVAAKRIISAGSQTYHVPVENGLASGIYLLRIVTEERTLTERVRVVR